MSNPLPRRRTLHLSIQHVGQETLIYDEQTHRAFCLNAVAAAIWNRCDGVTTISELALSVSLALALPVTDELVQLSLAELLRDGLLEPCSSIAATTDISRRAAMLKLGARAAMLLPLVAVITAPAAAQAYSGCANCTAPTPNKANPNTDIFSTKDSASPSGYPQ